MQWTETLYFGDFLLFVNKERWQGSPPISCTLPHNNALAHWRQVRRNYLFQGGYPRYHLICTPPRRGSPPRFPQSPRTVGYGPHPWRQVWNFSSRVATPGTSRSVLPQERPLPGPLLPSRPSLPPKFYPQPVWYFLNVVSLVEAQTKPRKRIINLGLSPGRSLS